LENQELKIHHYQTGNRCRRHVFRQRCIIRQLHTTEQQTNTCIWYIPKASASVPHHSFQQQRRAADPSKCSEAFMFQIANWPKRQLHSRTERAERRKIWF